MIHELFLHQWGIFICTYIYMVTPLQDLHFQFSTVYIYIYHYFIYIYMYIDYISRCGAKTAFSYHHWFYNFHQETHITITFPEPKVAKDSHRFCKSPGEGWLFDVMLKNGYNLHLLIYLIYL